MAAAYASLVSLMTVIDHIQHHPRPPITLDNQQIQPLCNNITFLQDFLEAYYSPGVLDEVPHELETRIKEAAYLAEDIIESHVVDQILDKKKNQTADFYLNLQKVLQDFDFLGKEVMEIKERTLIHDYQLSTPSMPSSSVRYPPKKQKNDMVCFDDVLLQLLDKLTRQPSGLQIFPIEGMGGIGKTTLARNAYENQFVKQHFDIRSWVTVSQEYSVQEIILEILSSKSQESEEELGIKLYQYLWGRRYLVVIDDIWRIEVWDKIRHSFPDNNNGSRIMFTTRISNMTLHLTNSHGLKLNCLDEDNSWKLLCRSVFGEEICPMVLEEIGRKIVKKCEGLPLSIVVLGGLLSKSPRTRECWEHIAENFKSNFNLEDDERCLNILQTSYNYLPIHLKPCFLYMGIFLEDSQIRVSTLVKQWIAEGFLKSNSGQNLEIVAQSYLNDLVDRNLILAQTLGINGKVKYCRIHDLVRDMCLKEAEKEKFFYIFGVRNLGVPNGINTRCIVNHAIELDEGNNYQVFDAFPATLPVRSLIANFNLYHNFLDFGCVIRLPFRLLRVLNFRLNHEDVNVDTSLLINLRFLHDNWPPSYSRLHLLHHFWNLQTLILNSGSGNATCEIWKMPLLRHVHVIELVLAEPPFEQEFVLSNLQALSWVKNFKFSEEVVKRIPNIRKLKISYETVSGSKRLDYCINNLSRLQKLETLVLFVDEVKELIDCARNLNFPHSLRKLTLRGTKLNWEDVTTILGSLPLLQVLRLHDNSTKGSKWNLVEGKFCSLKILGISGCKELEYWSADSTHFPCLEQIKLSRMSKLKEIPSGIGDIPTLQSIEMLWCSESVVISAKKILDEQEEFGNYGLRIIC